MLRSRVLTAVVLAALAVWIVWWAPGPAVPVAFALLGTLAAWEWAPLAGLAGTRARAVYAGCALAAFAAVWALVRSSAPLDWLVVGALVVWVPAGLLVGGYALGWCRRRLPVTAAVPLGLTLLATAWMAVVAPHTRLADGQYWLTALFVLVWGSDIGGYIAGRRFGRHRLAPSVSPGKTWEGAVGGLGLAVVGLALLIAGLDALNVFTAGTPWHHLLLAPLVVAAAVGGDLFESMLKRQAGVKDSGRLIPGHGGVLDRLDALLMAAPVLAAIAAWGG